MQEEKAILFSNPKGKESSMASQNLEEVAQYLKKMKFRKAFFGFKPASVWKKLEDLDGEYRSAIQVMEIGYQARIQERDEKIASLEEELAKLKG